MRLVHGKILRQQDIAAGIFMYEKLRVALDVANTLREAYCADCMRVWHELCVAEPELTDAILGMGSDEPAAAQWVCQLRREGLCA